MTYLSSRISRLVEPAELTQLQFCLGSPEASAEGRKWAGQRLAQLRIAAHVMDEAAKLASILSYLTPDESRAVQMLPVMPDHNWNAAAISALEN